MEIEKYSDRELSEMQEYCVYMRNCFKSTSFGYPQEIHEIALREINRELDTRKIQAEGSIEAGWSIEAFYRKWLEGYLRTKKGK